MNHVIARWIEAIRTTAPSRVDKRDIGEALLAEKDEY